MINKNDALYYDIVIAGGGAAGLSLAYRLADLKFKHLKIALVDPVHKSGTDHTWCSWLKGDHIFDQCAQNNFSKIRVSGGSFNREFDIHPFRYRMIESYKFYDFVNPVIDQAPHIVRIKKAIKSITEEQEKVKIILDSGESITGGRLMKSYVDNIEALKSNNDLYVDQHFKGWFIKTADPYFKVDTCTFMDFNIDQKGETRFMYVLPTSPCEALVEVAIFSNKILSHEEYDEIISGYISKNLGISEYEIKDTEFGIIPMTVKGFETSKSDKITLFGTAGGGVKASTGFAFERIQRQCDVIADSILYNKPVPQNIFPVRFTAYDATLLHIILSGKIAGADVFVRLFQKNTPQQLFKFLDDKTNLLEELRIMSTTDKLKFGTSFLSVIKSLS